MYPSPEWWVPGWPRVYAYWGQFLVMLPAPFAQFTAQIRATNYPTPFTVGNMAATSDFRDKDDILINWTLGYKHRSYGRLDRATYHENLVNELVAEAIEFDDSRPDIEVSHDVGVTSMSSTPYWQDPFVPNQP
jgi:hypothetical protein